MAWAGKLRFIPILLAGIVSVFLMGAANRPPARSAEPVILSGPVFDKDADAITVSMQIKPGVDRVADAQRTFQKALDLLAATESGTTRKILQIGPGRYVFSRPVIFKQRHLGIDLMGAPGRTRPLTRKKIAADAIRVEIERLRPHLPVIDGDGATSFLVVDGVMAGAHLTTHVSGFYFIDQMAGLGGNYYPDFSYRLKDDRFKPSGGYYSGYAFSDGGVVTVLGNASVTFEDNIVDHPSAYQCGGVLRNEQYGAAGSTSASVVEANIVIDPSAWHTGAFVDNNTGSYVQVRDNQILIDDPMPNPVGMVTNFDGAFLVAENNRFIDIRNDKQTPSIGLRILGREGAVIAVGNTFEGIDRPREHLAGSPPFPKFRDFYFLIRKGKIIKLLQALASGGQIRFVRPTEWPAEMTTLVRTDDLEDDDQLRIAVLRIHFDQVRSDIRKRHNG